MLNLKTKILFLTSLFLFLSGMTANAQLPAPNTSGVSSGHTHLVVPNVAKHREIWKLLGGVERTSGRLQALMFPGMFILLREGQPSAVQSIPRRIILALPSMITASTRPNSKRLVQAFLWTMARDRLSPICQMVYASNWLWMLSRTYPLCFIIRISHRPTPGN